MDSFQQPHQYMRPPPPPPPPMGDPHQRPPPVPPQGSWYSGQFQYHPTHSPSPPPPPPPLHHWSPSLPPPHSEHLLPSGPLYAPHPNPPYHAHSHQSQYPPPPPPPRPPMPPSLHPHSQPPYHQEWGVSNWAHHSGWDYPVNSNEEDWAARARAWAASRAAMENQHPQSQFLSASRLEEQPQYPNQYPHAADPQYHDIQQTSIPMSSYQNYPVPAAPLDIHQQELTSVSSGQPSFALDRHFSLNAKDGNVSVESSAAFPHQERLTSPPGHQLEVPSSNSSAPGKEDAALGQHHTQLSSPAISRSGQTEQTQFTYGNQSVDPMVNPHDQPLEFAPRFNFDNDPKMQLSFSDSGGPIRGTDSGAALPSLHPWTPTDATGISYPSIPPTFPSAPQHDPSLGMPPFPGQISPVFGRVPGPGFPSVIASVATPVTTFPGDAYMGPMGSERPKKAAVPNWLREEIIKKKAVITTSVPDHLKEENRSIEDEATDKSVGKGDQVDSRNVDSSRSTEEDDDDEDEMEAARTAAVNHEIKRILTEVLLKVTDELFDSIATRVLEEDDIPVDVDHDIHAPNRKLSSPPPFAAPKTSAKILIPAKLKDSEAGNVSDKSASGAPGDVLGLAGYASDDDDGDEIQSSSKLMSNSDNGNISSSNNEIPKDMNDAVENGHAQAEAEEQMRNSPVNAEEGHVKNNLTPCSSSAVDGNLVDRSLSKGLNNSDHDPMYSSGALSWNRKDDVRGDDRDVVDHTDACDRKNSMGKLTASTPGVPLESNSSRMSGRKDSQERDSRKHDRHESKRSSSARDSVKEIGSGKVRDEEKGEENHGKRDERPEKKHKLEDYNGSKERSKEQGKHGDKTKETDSRKRSTHGEVKDGRKEKERGRKGGDKDDSDRKRERRKVEKADRSKHKVANNTDRHKRWRSSSVGTESRNSEDDSLVSHSDHSIDDASGDSRRKLHSKRCDLSPSSDRSRQRGRRSRSRSPVRWRDSKR
ncbi:hypothetical protein Ancab_018912 [Ancistrocladus abbreviatus]